jgi:ATP-binding cassette subfamily B protein RaxB
VLIDSRGSALDDSLRENIRLWDQDSDDEACAQALYLAGFEEALQLPDGLDTALGRRELSNGQLRRVLLARALLRRPHLLVLDDALEALDLPLVRRILQRLKQSGITLIITSPRADVLSLCDWRLQVAAGGWQLDNYR